MPDGCDLPLRKPPGRASTITRADVPSPARRYLTPTEVAREMRVTSRTVYNKIRTGELPAFRFGRSWRIERQELGPKKDVD